MRTLGTILLGAVIGYAISFPIQLIPGFTQDQSGAIALIGIVAGAVALPLIRRRRNRTPDRGGFLPAPPTQPERDS